MPPIRSVAKRFLADPRYPQIAVQTVLLAYGSIWLGFVLNPWAIPFALMTALLLEGALFRYRSHLRPSPPYPSAIATTLSTLLLFRSTEFWTYGVVVAVAIASKVLIRFRGRHFINPSNGGIVLGAALLPGWVASGQWGNSVLFVFCLVAGAVLILSRAGRLDSAASFLLGCLGLQLLRHFALDYQWGVVGQFFSNGSLWLFALYMLTDPRTTPQARWARLTHGTLVAVVAIFLLQFFYVRDSFLWALLLMAPTVPLVDALEARRVSARTRTGDSDAPAKAAPAPASA